MKSHSGNQHFDLAILGLLQEEPQHGYELHRRMLSSFGTLFEPSWGSLYPALSRLERNGFIEGAHSSLVRNRIPSTGSLSGELAAFRASAPTVGARRQRKSYSITASGRLHFVDLLDRIDVNDDRSFWIGLSFSDGLTQPKQSALLNKRKYVLEDRLRDLKESRHFGVTGMRSVAAKGLSERLANEMNWLDSIKDSLITNDEGTPNIKFA